MPKRLDRDVRPERNAHYLVANELARQHDRPTEVVTDARDWLQRNRNRRRVDVILVTWTPADAELLRYALSELEDGMILAASPRVAWAKRRENERARRAEEIPSPRDTSGR